VAFPGGEEGRYEQTAASTSGGWSQGEEGPAGLILTQSPAEI
jgi:hypothetical protein